MKFHLRASNQSSLILATLMNLAIDTDNTRYATLDIVTIYTVTFGFGQDWIENFIEGKKYTGDYNKLACAVNHGIVEIPQSACFATEPG